MCVYACVRGEEKPESKENYGDSDAPLFRGLRKAARTLTVLQLFGAGVRERALCSTILSTRCLIVGDSISLAGSYAGWLHVPTLSRACAPRSGKYVYLYMYSEWDGNSLFRGCSNVLCEDVIIRGLLWRNPLVVNNKQYDCPCLPGQFERAKYVISPFGAIREMILLLSSCTLGFYWLIYEKRSYSIKCLFRCYKIQINS